MPGGAGQIFGAVRQSFCYWGRVESPGLQNAGDGVAERQSQTNPSEETAMSGFWWLMITVYGSSLACLAGAGLAARLSPRFRAELVGR